MSRLSRLLVGLLFLTAWLGLFIGFYAFFADEAIRQPWIQLLFFLVLIVLLGLSAVLARTRRARGRVSPVTPHGKAESWVRRAFNLFEQGDYAAAVEAYDRAVEQGPWHATAYVGRGIAYCHLDQFAEALRDLDVALRLDPEQTDAYFWRYHAHSASGNNAQAWRDLHEVLRREPDNPRALTHRAGLLLQEHKTAEALADINRALSLGGRDSHLFFLHGAICLARKQFEVAIQDFSEALRRHHKQAGRLHADRGLAWYFLGAYDRALDDFQEALDLGEENGTLYNNRGAAFLKKGQYGCALKDLETALRLQPELPNAHRHIAWLRATCPLAEYRDGERAVFHARKAVELAGDQAPAWLEVVAAAYAEAGEFSEAIAWQERFLRSGDGTAEGALRLELYRRGVAYREAGLGSVGIKRKS